MNSNTHSANSLLSIMKYYGDCITDSQYLEVMNDVADLSESEQGKFRDLVRYI